MLAFSNDYYGMIFRATQSVELFCAYVVTALPTTPVHAESKKYWTESKERVGIVEKVMNDGSIGSTFNEGHLTVEGEDAYCIDINTDWSYVKKKYKLNITNFLYA